MLAFLPKALSGKFDALYKDEPFIVREKAKVLFVIMAFLSVVSLVVTMDNFIFEAGPVNWMDVLASSSVFVILLSGLVLLYRGRYGPAANGIVIMSTVMIIAGWYGQGIADIPGKSYMGYIYYIFPVIIMAAFFASRLIVHVLTIVFFGANVIYYRLFCLDISDPFHDYLGEAIRDTSFAFWAVYGTALAFAVVTDRALHRLEHHYQMNTELSNSLERQVQERTRALEESTRQLQQTNEDIRKIIYFASHDLSEPLRTIAGYIQLIDRRCRDRLTKEGQEFLDMTLEGAFRMRSLIDDMLSYSRVDSKGKPFTAVSLNHVITSVKKQLAMTLQEKGAVIEWDPLPEIMADIGQMEQLFTNLVNNGIKFNKSRHPRVSITCAENKNTVTIAVRDNGIGIDPDDYDKIFDMFKRLHSRAHYEGTGIGLAICKKIVERHRGRIRIESKTGERTTFFIELPRQ